MAWQGFFLADLRKRLDAGAVIAGKVRKDPSQNVPIDLFPVEFVEQFMAGAGV